MEAEVETVKKELTGLPKGWSWRVMEDVADVIGGATPKTGDPEHYEGGNIAWLTPADLSGYTEKYIEKGARFITKKGLESCSTKLLPKGTVLFTSRAPIGYVAIASGEVCTNQGFKSFVLDESQVTSDYVYWWLKGSKSMAEEVASGTTFLELSTAKAKKLPIPVAPLPEQRRIVEAIELQLGRLDAAVAGLVAAKAKLKRYKQAVLKAAVEGRLTNPDLEEGELPESWSIVRLTDLVTEGPSNGYSPKPTKDQEGTKSLKLSATTSGRMILNEATIKYIPEVVPRTSKYWLRKGDVLLQRANSLEYLGSAAMYEGPEYEYIYPDLMMRVRLENELLARYLVYFLNSTTARNYFIKRATGTAGNMPKINGETVRELEVPVPPPNELAHVLQLMDGLIEQTDSMETTLDAQLAQSTRLRQAVLKRAFEGRLV